ncbi:hypothetical protein AB1L30_17955 [Bremerella sp. JC817]|uniref:hypothetical protein n=1 Tax=Bremerella sp. JC817 TaxID=3231756 RepID=UPI003459FE31
MVTNSLTSLILLTIPTLLWSLASEGRAQTLQSQLEGVVATAEEAANRCDFKAELELILTLRELNNRLPAELSTISDEHIAFVLSDLQKAVSFSEEEMELARARQAARMAAFQFFRQRQPEEGQRKFLEAIDYSTRVFGERSYHTIELQSSLANEMLLHGSKLEEAIQLAHQVRDTLEEDQQQKCFVFCQINQTLYALYVETKAFHKAMPYGNIALRELEAVHSKKSTRYLTIQGSMAAVLNQDQRPDLALVHAQTGLNTGYIPDGSDVKYYLRLLREYARAKRALGDFERVPEAYQEMLRIAKSYPTYPKNALIEHLREYQTALKEMGDEEGQRSVEAEIEERLQR